MNTVVWGKAYMRDKLIALDEIGKLNRKAERICEECPGFRQFVQSKSSTGKVCSFVNLVKYLLKQHLGRPVNDQFLRNHKGIYKFTLLIAAWLKNNYSSIDAFTKKELVSLILWKYVN